MTIETSISVAEKKFLAQLYQQTKGDQNLKVDTAAIGAAMGIDKSDARKLSEELIGQGFIAVKTLSGGIGITTEGIAEAERLGAGSESSQPRLGNTPVLTADDRKTVEETLERLKRSLNQSRLNFDAAAELVIDVKTVEVQLLSPKPKRAIIIAGLNSMLKLLEHADTRSAQLIRALIAPPD